MSNTEKVREKIVEFLSDNIALYDCDIDCPDEVATNPDLRTGKYCDRCIANKILAIPELHIEAEDQEARKFIGAPAQKLGYEEAIEDMKKDNFIKCEPKVL